MRIGMTVPLVGFQGGVERLAHATALGLRSRGHRVVLLAGPDRGRDADAFAAGFDAVAPRRSPRDAGPLDVVLAQKALDPADLDGLDGLPVVAAAHDHDHTCARRHRYLPVGRTPCHRAPGVACVAHGCALVRRPGGLALVNPFGLRSSLRRLSGRAHLLACSRYVADRLVDAGASPGRVHVLHPSTPATPRPTVARPAALRLVVVGQLLRGKGVEHAIDALAWLPSAELSVVGDGPSRAELSARARRVAPGRVHFEGFTPAHLVDDHYDRASVALVPSHWPEPFGMTGIEAMRRARPVVGADHGGIPEWLSDGTSGFLFRPADPRSLADAIERAHRDRDLGDRALADALRRFDHARYLDGLERLLSTAARSPLSPSLSASLSPPLHEAGEGAGG